MAIYLIFLYFIIIHCVIISYYIFILISNQSKDRIVSLNKTCATDVIEKFKKTFEIDTQVIISSPKITQTSSFRLTPQKFFVDSKYANISYLDNITLVAASYFGSTNSWIKNEIYLSNYLLITYYCSIIFCSIFFILEDTFSATLSLISLSLFTVIILIDMAIRQVHSTFTLDYLAEFELIDAPTERNNANKILNIWKVKSLEIYYRIIIDIVDFLFRRKKQTSP